MEASHARGEISDLLLDGDGEALEELTPLVYAELRATA